MWATGLTVMINNVLQETGLAYFSSLCDSSQTNYSTSVTDRQTQQTIARRVHSSSVFRTVWDGIIGAWAI